MFFSPLQDNSLHHGDDDDGKLPHCRLSERGSSVFDGHPRFRCLVLLGFAKDSFPLRTDFEC